MPEIRKLTLDCPRFISILRHGFELAHSKLACERLIFVELQILFGWVTLRAEEFILPAPLNSLPPPSVEWRRESDQERIQRLERAGVLESPPAGNAVVGNPNVGVPQGAGAVERLRKEAESNQKQMNKNFSLWWSADAARWRAWRSPRGTSTIADGSFAVGAEVTHPSWLLGNARVSFGPKAVFYNGGQYAPLRNSNFSGSGYADFSASELGLSSSLHSIGREVGLGSSFYWSGGLAYTPVRWVRAQRASSSPMIDRSDTRTKVALNLPGLLLQAGAGFDWQSLLRAELFAAVHGAWPVQVRLRTGLQLSMGTSIDERSLSSR